MGHEFGQVLVPAEDYSYRLTSVVEAEVVLNTRTDEFREWAGEYDELAKDERKMIALVVI